jgi:protease-4
MLHSSGYKTVEYICNAILNGTFAPEIADKTIVSCHGEVYRETDSHEKNYNPFDAWQADSIAIIPLTGLMTKYGTWWSMGVDDVATYISLAYESNNISAVILKGDTPGGDTDSIFHLQEVLADKKKPTYGFVDGMCASCGYIAFSYLDKIYAINRMTRVGSVGVCVMMAAPNDSRSNYKIIEAYPKESKDKNLEQREMLKGNDAPMKEMLSKYAIYFQDIVKANRPSVQPETLTGKMYYAYEAETLGLIDGIRTLTEVVSEINALTESRKKILFNL